MATAISVTSTPQKLISGLVPNAYPTTCRITNSGAYIVKYAVSSGASTSPLTWETGSEIWGGQSVDITVSSAANEVWLMHNQPSGTISCSWDTSVDYPTDTPTSRLAAQAALGVTSITPRISSVALLGDSITVANYTGSASANNLRTTPHGYFTFTNMFLQGALSVVPMSPTQPVFATSGWKTSDIISNAYHTTAASSAADSVSVLIGTNDLLGGVSATATFANILTICEAIRSAGKYVLLGTIIPTNNVNETAAIAVQRLSLNAMIRGYAASAFGVILCDYFSALINPSTGGLNSADTWDGTHPSAGGASKMGMAQSLAISPYVQQQAGPRAIYPVSGSLAVTSNPFMLGNVSGLATGFTTTLQGAGTCVPTKATGSGSDVGDWQVLTVGATNVTADGVQFAPGWIGCTPGQSAYGLLRLSVDAGSNLHGLGLQITDNGGATVRANDYYSSYLTSGQMVFPSGAMTLVTPVMTFSAGATATQFSLFAYGSGVIRIKEMQVIRVP